MWKALRRSGWLLIATGILVVAYYVGNQTSPSVPNEITPYDPADLAPPTPIAEELSIPDPESMSPGRMNASESRRARIISVTAIHGMSQSRRDAPPSLPTIANRQLAERKPVRVEVVEVQGLPAKQSPPGTMANSSISLTQRKDLNDSTRQATSNRWASAKVTPKPHAILSLSPALPPAKTPVPVVRKHRPLGDEDVAWHVIDNPAAPSPRTVPAVTQLFSRESEVLPYENSASRGPNLDGPKAIPAPVISPSQIAQAEHEEPVTHTRENKSPPSPTNSLPETAPALDSPKVLPRVLPDVQALPLSDERVRVEELSPTKDASRSVEPANTKVISRLKSRTAPSVAKSPMESIGVVFLESPEEERPSPPRQLPFEVMESAPLMATQKLIARSLGSPDGVAANLADLKPDRPVSPAGGLILASAVMEGKGVAKPYTTTGVVNFRTSREEVAAQAHLDYVTSGLVILPATEEPTITPPLAVQEFLLKNAIRQACGDRVKNLEVVLEPNHSLKIRLQVANEADRKELSQTILTLQALGSYQITLSVQVASET
jgi:hypothetical protein